MSDYKMLAIDLGASSGRGIVGRFDGKKLTLEENHRFSNDPVTMAGTFYWDIMRIFFEIQNSIRKCALSEDKDIKSIGIDTWGVDFGLLDRHGRLLSNPVHYRDARTVGIQEYAFSKVDAKRLYGETGIAFMDFNSIFQLASLIKEDPRALDRADQLLFIPDLLNYFLTGKAVTEYSVASTGGLLDVKTRSWAMDIISDMGIPTGIFTEIAEPGTVLGKLLPQIQEHTGISEANVVHVAAHDTASAVVSVPAEGDEFIYISSGTWSLMGTELPDAITTEEACKCGFTNEGGAGGKIRFLRNIMGLWLEQESKRQWAREGKQFTYDQLSDMAMASKPLQSLINPDDPSFMAPGNLPRRIKAFCEKTGQHVPENEGEVVRCIFESLALKYRWTVENMDAMMGRRTPFINIVGGGTKEPPLCRFTAEACGRPVYAGPTEATAIGNLAVQLMAAGEIGGLAEARQVVRDSFDIKRYDPANTEAWDEGYERFLKLI